MKRRDVNRYGLVVAVRLEMDRRDFATSRAFEVMLKMSYIGS